MKSYGAGKRGIMEKELGRNKFNDSISRQAAIDALKTLSKEGHAYVNGAFFETILRDEAEQVLEELPSAQPERKKGKWILGDNDVAICSNCGIADDVYEYVKGWRYCPYCGCAMEGEQDGNQS